MQELRAEVSMANPEQPDLALHSDPGAAEPKIIPSVEPAIYLDRKHPIAIRWMHWINFPVLFTMIWSGLSSIGTTPTMRTSIPMRCIASGFGN